MPDILSPLGENLKRIRREKGLTLQELSTSSGVSVGMLSQIERGQANPSFRILFGLAKGLEVPVSYFFVGIEAGGHVVRKGNRKTLVLPRNDHNDAGNGILYQLLSPDLTGKIELLWIEYEEGVCTREIPFSHVGEECGVLLEGTLEVHMGDETAVLNPGDSVYLNSSIPHSFANVGDGRAIMVWAITPPSF